MGGRAHRLDLCGAIRVTTINRHGGTVRESVSRVALARLMSVRSNLYMTTTTTKAPKQVAITDIGSADDFLAEVEKTLK